MSRSKVKVFEQPDENTCGPASLRTALEILGQEYSFDYLVRICRTTRNGTSVKKMIQAANKLGISVLALEWGTLRHLQSALRNPPADPRAVIVNYLQDPDEDEDLEDCGHWSTVATYSARNARIVLFDPYTAKKKSYIWHDFLDRWCDYDYKRHKTKLGKRKFKLVRKWNNRLMLILARNPDSLPKFKIKSAKLFPSRKTSTKLPR